METIAQKQEPIVCCQMPVVKCRSCVVNCQRSIVSQRGYALLLTVLIVGAVAVAVASALLVFGIDANKNVLAEDQSKLARAMTDGCVEEALEQIRETSGFTGYGTLSLGGNTCSYIVTNTGGTTRGITASSTVGSAVRKARAVLSKVNPITVTSWQEVIDF